MGKEKAITLIISALAVLVGQQISAGTMETPTEQPQAKARFPQTAQQAERNGLPEISSATEDRVSSIGSSVCA